MVAQFPSFNQEYQKTTNMGVSVAEATLKAKCDLLSCEYGCIEHASNNYSCICASNYVISNVSACAGESVCMYVLMLSIAYAHCR